MNADCRDFRALLEGRLAGRAAEGRLAGLAWHEHLFDCADCRALLDAEEALESLLASLPEPLLAPAVKERVLARLRLAREDERLDRLLEVAALDAAPPDLARGVLRGVEARLADERLDRLLELDQIAVPTGLPGRTVAALRLARRATERRRVALRAAGMLAAAAAVAGLVWIGRDVLPPRSDPAPVIAHESAPAPAPLVAAQAVPDEMLESLDMLLDWDLLQADDLETILATLGPEAAALFADLDDEG
ncbi:MAG: hypothetical protein JNK02_02635 [Planctomycetes bacterium]|nr:hypothetical protein [Planctomycetota bacterium]